MLKPLFSLLVLAARCLCTPPPYSTRVLVVYDESNTDVQIDDLQSALVNRGFNVDVEHPHQHPKILKFGENLYDNVIVVPGKTKSFGKTLRTDHFMTFLNNGGNLVMLTTPQFNPATLRDVGKRIGIEIGAKGVQYEDHFNTSLGLPNPEILSVVEPSHLVNASVAKLHDSELLLGLLRGSNTSYSWNAIKDDSEVDTVLSAPFAVGDDQYLAAGLQSLKNSRILWLGHPNLLAGKSAEELLTWAFHERNELALESVRHAGLNNETKEYYSVNEPLSYCAAVKQWDPVSGAFVLFGNMSDVQLEFRMLDPYYRLNLNKNGCVEFNAPDQYGMFTFSLEYMRRGYTFITSKQVVTVLQRSNDSWPRSWTITNSWVYLGGVTTTAIGFIVFVFFYIMSPEPEFQENEKSGGKGSSEGTTQHKSKGDDVKSQSQSQPKEHSQTQTHPQSSQSGKKKNKKKSTQ